MKKLFSYLKGNPWSLIGSVATVIGFVFAVLVQFQQATMETEMRQIRSEVILHEYQTLNKELEARITKIENSLPIQGNLLAQSALSSKVKEVESKIEKIKQSTAILIMRYSKIYQIVVIFCLLLTTLFFVEFR